MRKQIEGQVAIVTGAGRGVGEVVAKTLAAAGARVAVNDINPDRAERVAAQIRAAGGQAIGVMADVSNKFHCVNLIETTRKKWGQLDILVNNAAVQLRSSILKLDEWDWDRCLDVNLKGVFLMSQLCGRVMADENRKRGGIIVNIGSVAGVQTPLAERAAYCAGSAGVAGFSRECAREYAQYGIRVNTLLRGVPASLETTNADRGSKEVAAQQAVADAVLFLCSDVGGEMTGRTITVDGEGDNR